MVPSSVEELMARASALEGLRVTELAERLAFGIDGEAVATKGKVGELLERALGASGVGAEVDFPTLGVEMKSVPFEQRRVVESTFVCALSLMDTERAEFETSWVRRKLARVSCGCPSTTAIASVALRSGRRRPRLKTAALKDDFDEIVGRIAIGDIEDLSAHVGRWLQLRPKAATGSVRTSAPGREGELVSTVPRGFYLRARFVAAILDDPTALP